MLFIVHLLHEDRFWECVGAVDSGDGSDYVDICLQEGCCYMTTKIAPSLIKSKSVDEYWTSRLTPTMATFCKCCGSDMVSTVTGVLVKNGGNVEYGGQRDIEIVTDRTLGDFVDLLRTQV